MLFTRNGEQIMLFTRNDGMFQAALIVPLGLLRFLMGKMEEEPVVEVDEELVVELDEELVMEVDEELVMGAAEDPVGIVNMLANIATVCLPPKAN